MKKNNQLTTIVKESGLQQNKVDNLLESFTGHFEKAKRLSNVAKEIVVTDESQVDLMSKARDVRLDLKHGRGRVEETRKKLKEQSLREGRAIDGISNVIKALIVPVEEHLLKQEKFVEIRETERLEKIHEERVGKLSQYVEDISLYNLKDMSTEAFDNLLKLSKKAIDDKKAAEIKVEKDRISKEKAEAKEQERIRLENEKLRKEAEAREKVAEEERIENEDRMAKERKKREKVEEELRKEREEQKREQKKIEDERIAKKEADDDIKKQKLLAPDKEKLIDLAGAIDKIVFPMVESLEAGEVLREAQKSLSVTSTQLRTKAKTL